MSKNISIFVNIDSASSYLKRKSLFFAKKYIIKTNVITIKRMIHYLIILRLHLVQIFQKYNIFLVLFIMKENMYHAISTNQFII